MSTFFIGLDSWIIQDGNYGDFHRGQEATFAVEFHPERVALSRVHKPSVERIEPNDAATASTAKLSFPTRKYG